MRGEGEGSVQKHILILFFFFFFFFLSPSNKIRWTTARQVTRAKLIKFVPLGFLGPLLLPISKERGEKSGKKTNGEEEKAILSLPRFLLLLYSRFIINA